MLLDFGFPELFAGGNIHREDIRALIAKVCRGAADRDRGSHRSASNERPVFASALRIQRIDVPGLTADVNAVAHDSRLAVRPATGIREGPFQFQAGDLRDRQRRRWWRRERQAGI